MGARGILEIVDVMYGDWRYRLDGMIDRRVLPMEEMKREPGSSNAQRLHTMVGRPNRSNYAVQRSRQMQKHESGLDLTENDSKVTSRQSIRFS